MDGERNEKEYEVILVFDLILHNQLPISFRFYYYNYFFFLQTSKTYVGKPLKCFHREMLIALKVQKFLMMQER